MNLLKKLTSAMAAAVLFAGPVHGAPILTEWVFNPAGGGFDSGMFVAEYLDANGNTFVQIERTAGDGFTFRRHGAFNVVQADSNGQLFPVVYPAGTITGLYETYGAGELGGSSRFAGGTVRLYQNPVGGRYGSGAGIYGANLGNLIAELAIQAGGSGTVDAWGTPVANGTVDMFAVAGIGDLASGYFFGGDGSDLSAKNIRFNLNFTNSATLGSPWGSLVDELACQYAGFTGPGCGSGTYQDVPGAHFFISENGQIKLSEVPEPGSLALFGVAMLAAGVARGRRTVRRPR